MRNLRHHPHQWLRFLRIGVVWCAVLAVAFPAMAADPASVPAPNRAEPLLGSTSVGQQIAFSVSLAPINPAAIDAFLADLYNPQSPNYQQYLTPAQYTARFYDPNGRAIVRDFLTSQNLTVDDSGVGSILMVSGTTTQVETAFAVRLYDYRAASGRVFHVNNVAPALPATVSPFVTGIVGLDTSIEFQRNLPPPGPSLVGANDPTTPPAQDRAVSPRTSAVTPCQTALNIVQFNPANSTGNPYEPVGNSLVITANQMATAYNFDALYAGGNLGQGITAAVIEPGTNYTQSYVETYRTCYAGITADSTPVVVPPGATIPNSVDGEIETELDIETILGLAPHLTSLLVYQTATFNNTGIINGFQAAINNPQVSVISASFGGCDLQSGEPSFAASLDPVLQQASGTGKTVFVSSGDMGSENCVNSGSSALSVDYPGSSPYVTSVGGTRLFIGASNAYQTEYTWNDYALSPSTPANTVGTGGISAFEARPTYQSGPGISTSSRRQVPDVSADADPLSAGYLIYAVDPNGSSCGGAAACYQTSGGTSASSPLWAAATALLDQSLLSRSKPKVGQLNNQLYTIYRNTAGTAAYPFHDVTHGDNCYLGPTCGTASGSLHSPPVSASYTTHAGYNLATGIGTPDFGKLSLALLPTPNPQPTPHPTKPAMGGPPAPQPTPRPTRPAMGGVSTPIPQPIRH